MIEDRLTFDDEPSLPKPAPAVVVPVAPRVRLAFPAVKTLLPYVVMAFAVGFGGWQWYRNRDVTPSPTPTPTVDGAALGKAFVPKLAASLADGFDAAATMLAAGTSAKDADEALKAKFQANRWAAFAELAGPSFDAIVPAGQEPKDAAAREAFAELHRAFAKGLRGAK